VFTEDFFFAQPGIFLPCQTALFTGFHMNHGSFPADYEVFKVWHRHCYLDFE